MKYHTLKPDEAKRRIEECIYKHPGSKTSEITDSKDKSRVGNGYT